MKKIKNTGSHCLVLGAYPGSVVGFRGDLIRVLRSKVDRVTVATAPAEDEEIESIESLNVSFVPYPIHRNAIAPLADIKTLLSLFLILRRERPDYILAYTIKPVIWGALAARALPSVRFTAMVTGLGFAFSGQGIRRRLLTRLVAVLYRLALRRAAICVFQNEDNRREFVGRKILPEGRTRVVAGSGVNLTRFPFTDYPGGSIRFLTIARLVGEKGLRELAVAAEVLRAKYPEAIVVLLGPADPSPDAIKDDELKKWINDGTILYLGSVADVRPEIARCHVLVLPSYHEGMPRTVLEGMAMGRAILTTDVSGCRETVEPGVNGWLVPARNAEALADRMIWYVENSDCIPAMGRASRSIVERKFDVEEVNRQMCDYILGVDKVRSNCRSDAS